jgi:hypothetical protein
MSYKIEYLAGAGVVHSKTPYASNLADITAEARKSGVTAKTLFGASSFQIRDMNDVGKVVVSEAIA